MIEALGIGSIGVGIQQILRRRSIYKDVMRYPYPRMDIKISRIITKGDREECQIIYVEKTYDKGQTTEFTFLPSNKYGYNKIYHDPYNTLLTKYNVHPGFDKQELVSIEIGHVIHPFIYKYKNTEYTSDSLEYMANVISDIHTQYRYYYVIFGLLWVFIIGWVHCVYLRFENKESIRCSLFNKFV